MEKFVRECRFTPGCPGPVVEREDGYVVCEECGGEDFSNMK